MPATAENDATTGDPADLVFCEGWDPFSRAVIGQLSAEEAAARDGRGERYAVLLLDHARPAALVELAWQSQVCTVWRFDDQQRRMTKHELRRVDGDELVVSEQVRWHYPDPECPEFSGAARRHTVRCSAGGLLHEVDEPDGEGGGSWHRFGTLPEVPRHKVPRFGDRAALVSLTTAVAALPPDGEPAPACRGLALSPLVAEPWQPPVPMQPAVLAALCRAGSRWWVPGHGEAVLEVERVGVLRMPTGRLLVSDLAGVAGGEPFTVRAPAGDHPVEWSLVRPPRHPGRPIVVAVRVLIGAEPVTRWELALRSSSDPRRLAGWGFVTCEITTGGMCLVDAGARSGLARGLRPERLAPVGAGQIVQIDEAEIGNLIAVPIPVGAYLTWIGRTDQGRVACFLTDLLHPHGARMLA